MTASLYPKVFKTLKGVKILVVNLFFPNLSIGYLYVNFEERGFTSFISNRMNNSSWLQVSFLKPEWSSLRNTHNSDSCLSVLPEDGHCA